MNKNIIGYLYFSRKSEKLLKTVKTTKNKELMKNIIFHHANVGENEEEGKINER